MFEHDILEGEPAGDTPQELIDLVRAQAALLTSVATGGPQIKEVDPQYQERRKRIRLGLKRLGIDDPFPWRSPWDWYAYYSAELVGYASRRAYISGAAGPVIDELEEQASSTSVTDFGGDTETWPTIETRIREMIAELDGATSVDDLQDVGRRCREITTAAANLVFDEAMVPSGADVPGANDAVARVGLYLDTQVTGSENARLRGLIRKQLDLAQQVTHDAEVTRLQAFAAAQATVSVVRIIQEAERLRAAGS